jgi:hypothetical protein
MHFVIQHKWHTLTPIRFGTKVPSSGNSSVLVLYSKTLIISHLHCQFLVIVFYTHTHTHTHARTHTRARARARTHTHEWCIQRSLFDSTWPLQSYQRKKCIILWHMCIWRYTPDMPCDEYVAGQCSVMKACSAVLLWRPYCNCTTSHKLLQS